MYTNVFNSLITSFIHKYIFWLVAEIIESDGFCISANTTADGGSSSTGTGEGHGEDADGSGQAEQDMQSRHRDNTTELQQGKATFSLCFTRE